MTELLRVLIVDDEPLARQAVRLLLAGDHEVTVVAECSGVEAVALVERTEPDILFLDIHMPQMDGFDVLEAIGIDHAPTVVFVTAYTDHALRAFEVHAIDYLLKPLVDARFAQALARAKEQARLRRARQTTDPRLSALLRDHTRATHRILVHDRGKTRIVDTGTIDWVEAADYYVQIHVGRETHLLRETMNELAERLDPEQFFRVHRSAIINLDRVREIHHRLHGDGELLLANGTRVRLSRSRRQEFDRLFGSSRRRS